MHELPGLLRHLIFGHFCAKAIKRSLQSAIQESPLRLDKDDRVATMRSISWKAGEIMVSDNMRVLDPPSRGHLEWSAWILAAYQVLRPRFESDKAALSFLEQASIRGFDTRLLRLGIWLLLRSCRGNLDRVKAMFGAGLTQYGATFDWSIPQSENEIQMRITRCFYVDFFASHGLPQLTTVLCRLDSLWFNRIEAAKHGLMFDAARYQTMSRGADTCVFPIVKVSMNQSG